MIGWGAHRPVFVLGDNTPGFSSGVAAMVIFAGARPRGARPTDNYSPASPTAQARVPFPPPDSVPPNPNISDANPGTFY